MIEIPLAIIGCGEYVGAHLRELPRVPEFRVVALVDIVPGRARRLAEKHLSGLKVGFYEDHEAMLREIKPAAVVVSTPHVLHYTQCMDALSAGAHVLVDKPMVTHPDHARRLVAFAAERKLALLVAAQGFYSDTFAYVRQVLAQGELGPLQVASGLMASGWLQYGAGTWRQDPHASGGGNLHDSAVHVLGVLLALVNSPVREVFCWTDKKDLTVDVNAVALLRFANGVLATLTNGGNCPTWDSYVHLQGEQGLVRLNPYGGGLSLRLQRTGTTVTTVPEGWAIPSVTPLQNFADVIRGVAGCRCDGRIGILVSDVLEGLYASGRCGVAERITRQV